LNTQIKIHNFNLLESYTDRCKDQSIGDFFFSYQNQSFGAYLVPWLLEEDFSKFLVKAIIPTGMATTLVSPPTLFSYSLPPDGISQPEGKVQLVYSTDDR